MHFERQYAFKMHKIIFFSKKKKKYVYLKFSYLLAQTLIWGVGGVALFTPYLFIMDDHNSF